MMSPERQVRPPRVMVWGWMLGSAASIISGR